MWLEAVQIPLGDNRSHQRMNQATTLTSQVITGNIKHQPPICRNENELTEKESNTKLMRVSSVQVSSSSTPRISEERKYKWIIIGERAEIEKQKRIETLR